MGGLRKYMPITWLTSLVGTLALVGTPFFAGFYSKETIIEAVKFSSIPGAGIAYWAVLSGVFITSFYSFRMYFLVFHGKERFDQMDHHDDGHGHDDHHGHGHGPFKPHETPAVVTVPLVLLAIPSVVVGALTIDAMVYGSFFDGAIAVLEKHTAMATLAEHWHGWVAMGNHGFVTVPFWRMVAGAGSAWYCYLVNPKVPEAIAQSLAPLKRLLDNKYYFDAFNDWFFAGGSRRLGTGLWRKGDQAVIDGAMVNGSARLVGWFAGIVRTVQTGLLNQYAIAMIVGIAMLLAWFIFNSVLTHR